MSFALKRSIAVTVLAGLASALGTSRQSAPSYDAIVVGAGVAGNVVAERLAASGAKTLLLERGPASTAQSGGQTFLPWNDTITVFDLPSFAGGLASVNESYFCDDTASKAGCVFGGSGSLNSLVWVPPSSWDFEKWPAGWSYDNISGAYQAIEAVNPGTIRPSSDGIEYETGPYEYISKLFASNGWTYTNVIEDPNEKYQVFGWPPVNTIPGQGIRAGPADVLFAKALQNPNFTHQLDSYVVRVVRNGSTATGVEVQSDDGSRYIINVNEGGKIILTAGALSTPRILFNSGIGPKSQILVVQNGTTNVTLPPESDWLELPVGRNVRDHTIVPLTLDTKSGANFTYFNSTTLYFGGWNVSQVDQYNGFAAGPVSESGQRAISYTNLLGNDNQTRYFQNTYEETGAGEISVLVYQTHGATSVGDLGITANGSTIWLQTPWYNTDADIDASVEFLDIFRGYLANSTDLELDSSFSGKTSRELVTTTYTSGLHFCGSAVIGAENDGNSVVDLDVKVWGTDNLFVADASFHADLPTGNIQATVAIAAQAAVQRIIAYEVQPSK